LELADRVAEDYRIMKGVTNTEGEDKHKISTFRLGESSSVSGAEEDTGGVSVKGKRWFGIHNMVTQRKR